MALDWTFGRFSGSLMSWGQPKLDVLFLVWLNKCRVEWDVYFSFNYTFSRILFVGEVYIYWLYLL